LSNTDNETLIARFVQAIESISAAIERGDTVVELVLR
jgi:hypothetical protein